MVDQGGTRRATRAPRSEASSRGLLGVAALFALAGLAHFVVPRLFESIVPPWLPAWLGGPRSVVYLSGVAELAGGMGLLPSATRTVAGWGLIALLIAVFPANVQMLLDARSAGAASWYVAALWLRLPMQPLLIWWVWRVAIRRLPRRVS